jgi:mono/diheme cytochrome c family protein
MRRIDFRCVWLAAVGCALGAGAAAVFAADSAPTGPTVAPRPVTVPPPDSGSAQHDPPEWGFFEQYCGKCHNSTDWAGEVAFDTMSSDNIGGDAKIWEEAVRKLRGRLMPPPDKPQPQQAQVDKIISFLETHLDAAGAQHPDPGQVVLHRLNRTEYAREVQDILGIKVDAAALLPQDTKTDGFDNVATSLRVSPSFLDQYIDAAHDVSVAAIGSASAATTSVQVRGTPGTNQEMHVPGLPLGTRGGVLAEHLFPADGEYTFNINQSAGFGGGYIAGLDSKQKLIMTLDGKKVYQTDVGGEEDLKSVDQKQADAVKVIRKRFDGVKLHVTAGPHKIGLAYVARTFAESDDTLEPLGANNLPRVPGVFGFEVVGPSHPTGVADTPARDKIFICYPKSADEEQPCAKRIVANIARRAYRRPVTDEDLAAPLRFYQKGHDEKGFEAGIQQAVMAILASPKFLYRIEAVPENATAGQIYHLSDLELASRLSFFLWSQGPDEELLKTAVADKLHEPAELQREVKRMLADRRSKALVTHFADQWLAVDDMDALQPDPTIYPEFDNALRAAYRTEIEMFLDSVFRSDQSVVRLLDANYTFVNERLAQEYGIPNIQGEQFRKVTLTDSHRFGLLGKGTFLMGTSYANRTSPVKRGAWVLEVISGTPPHAPPPGVVALKENTDGAKATTVRERMVAHRSNPSCNACHGILDPLGFSLENFDAIGGWRDKDREAATPIDTAGNWRGVPVKSSDDIRKVLLTHPDQFVQTVSEKLMTYALGRTVEYPDMPTVRAIVRDAAKDNYRFESIVMGIVNSAQFQEQMIPESGGGTPVKTAELTR